MNGDTIDVKKVLKWVGIIALVAIPVVLLLKDRNGREEPSSSPGGDEGDAVEFD